MRHVSILMTSALALLTGCERPSKKSQLPEAEKAYYASIIHYTNRPIITFGSSSAACEWVYEGAQIPAEVQLAVTADFFTQLGYSAQVLRQLKSAGVSLETRGLAEDIAARRAALGLSFSNHRQPSVEAEIIGWLADAISLDERHGDERQRDELRMKMAFQRLGNYAGSTLRAAADGQKASADLERVEKEIRLIIENHRIALGGKVATQLTNHETCAMEIIDEQRSRAEKVSRTFTPALLDQTLRGARVDDWTFEEGEIKKVNILSTQIAGHCILHEAVIEMVGARSGRAHKVKVRMAHRVYVNETVDLLALRKVK